MRVSSGRWAVVAAVSLAAALAAPVSAAATDGSVPPAVATYVADTLRDDLNDFYGPGADGNGLLFDDSTTFAAPSRVFVWTDDFLAGEGLEQAAQRINEWVTVVSVKKELVGVATVEIDADTGSPVLSVFDDSQFAATALLDVPAVGELVHDAADAAWLLVNGDTVTAVIVGKSGVTEPTTLSSHRAHVVNREQATVRSDSPGCFAFVGVALAVVVAFLALEAFLPSWRQRRVRPNAASADSADDADLPE